MGEKQVRYPLCYAAPPHLAQVIDFIEIWYFHGISDMGGAIAERLKGTTNVRKINTLFHCQPIFQA